VWAWFAHQKKKKVQESGESVTVQKKTISVEISEARHVFREIKILRNLNHVNVLAISEIFGTQFPCCTGTKVQILTQKALLAPENYDEFTAVFIVTDFYPADLSQIIRSPQQLTDVHVQTFIYQLLRGLKYIHSAHVLHRSDAHDHGLTTLT
jgi:mitogen-activated protein kinase 1/3